MNDERPGVLIGRIVIEKYATADNIEMYVDGFDGTDDALPLIDALGMLSFAEHHTWDSVVYAEDDE